MEFKERFSDARYRGCGGGCTLEPTIGTSCGPPVGVPHHIWGPANGNLQPAIRQVRLLIRPSKSVIDHPSRKKRGKDGARGLIICGPDQWAMLNASGTMG